MFFIITIIVTFIIVLVYKNILYILDLMLIGLTWGGCWPKVGIIYYKAAWQGGVTVNSDTRCQGIT